MGQKHAMWQIINMEPRMMTCGILLLIYYNVQMKTMIEDTSSELDDEDTVSREYAFSNISMQYL